MKVWPPILFMFVAGFLFSLLHIRSLRSGRITYYTTLGLAYQRTLQPFRYWFFTLATGFLGILLIVEAVWICIQVL